MGSTSRDYSAHMADVKGKGILYDDDDDPIKLSIDDDANAIKEFLLSLIGKILNPKKQKVEKLLQTMPTQWGMEDKLVANDLGNGKFLLNFHTEEDLNIVLRQGPFHYNFCMFVLVRWEPIVHDDYSWIIPFWVRMIGLPLHLWTDKNLRRIGGRLGHVDTLELTEGRMLIEIYSRRPLKFSRKVESEEGDAVTIQIEYDLLFKHCTTYGMLSHEKNYCPTNEIQTRLQAPRDQNVFSRVQLPPGRVTDRDSMSLPRAHEAKHSLMFDARNRGGLQHDEARALAGNYNVTRHVTKFNSDGVGNYGRERTAPQGRPLGVDDRRGAYDGSRREANRYDNAPKDRMMRSHEVRSGHRRGDTRHSREPYTRKEEHIWRGRPRPMIGSKERANEKVAIVDTVESQAVVPYEQWRTSDENSKDEPPLARNNSLRQNESTKTRRLASMIVSPTGTSHAHDGNVTIRAKRATRVLTFSPKSLQVEVNGLENDQMIVASEDMENDMEIGEQGEGGMMEDQYQECDLLGEELKELEVSHVSLAPQSSNAQQSVAKSHRMNAPLGIQSKKYEFLRRGSPWTMAAMSPGPMDQKDSSRRRGERT